MNDLFDKFIAYKIHGEGKNEKSINQYIRHITEFCNLFGINDIKMFTNDKVKEWLIHLGKNDNSPASRNVKLSAIKEFIRFLEDNRIAVDIDILKIKGAKQPHRESKFLREERAIEFIYNIGNERTRACAILTFRTGMRYCELIKLTVRDIERGYAVIIGKGNKERKVNFSVDCLTIVKKYIKNKRQDIINRTGKKTDLLILSDQGGVMSDRNYNESLKRWAKRCGIEWWQDMSSHKLRHSYATDKLSKGFDAKTVGYSMGHTNIATTSLYAHTDDDRVRDMQLGGTL